MTKKNLPDPMILSPEVYEKCSYVIDGPKANGSRAVCWRRRCKNRPLKGKSYCGVHKVYDR